MKRHLFLSTFILAVSLAATPSFAVTTGEDYMKACMGASSDNTELCTCKTEQAVKLADEEMLGYLVMSLTKPTEFTAAVNKGEVPEAVTKKWGRYVLQSNKVCRPSSE
ncbi:MAG: hypothetical protein ABIY37_00630 [Devosia sp.]